MNHIINKICVTIIALLLGMGLTAHAQESIDSLSVSDKGCENSAWEIGIGATGYQMTRFGLIDFFRNDKGGYTLHTNKRDVIFGGHLYLARELTKHFTLDLQGNFAYASDPVKNGSQSKWLAMADLGLQWRLGDYFDSKYVDPFFRLGFGYMYKSFEIQYFGNDQINKDRVDWLLRNDYNKSGLDRQHLLPVTLGTGVNMWLNDRFGIGLQADYLYMPYKDVANSYQGTVRLIWRLGGESKKSQPVVQYVDKIVEVPREVIKYVEVPAVVEESLCDLFNNIYFDFDKSDLLASNSDLLDRISEVMKRETKRRYLIIGYTDARGSHEYNQGLSERRAKIVMEALLERGVDPNLLKYKGVGKRASFMSTQKSHEIRRGDRKVVVEVIQNLEYWDEL